MNNGGGKTPRCPDYSPQSLPKFPPLLLSPRSGRLHFKGAILLLPSSLTESVTIRPEFFSLCPIDQLSNPIENPWALLQMAAPFARHKHTDFILKIHWPNPITHSDINQCTYVHTCRRFYQTQAHRRKNTLPLKTPSYWSSMSKW